ncbi:YwdI family protein [Bacillus solimangrovi]|uniref:YwdI family protein n=1 Tax=Bacillus solimangrovi TaxID=1305675 RepID=A0A1E5LGR0_9BACI|nr:YwdI family protein [Bacillus solimangrovi]OEH93254.1 hypothetical protein BFG57_12695 [Bacillus solimangrovi]
MNIPIKGLLHQMKNELELADRKVTLEEKQAVREHVHAIKTLCELILNEGENDKSYTPTVRVDDQRDSFQEHLHMMEHGKGKPVIPTTSPSTKSLQGKKIIEDDANGDSLFDF